MRLKKGLVLGLALALVASVLSFGATTTEAATKKKTVYQMTSSKQYTDMFWDGNLELTNSWESKYDKYGQLIKTVSVYNNTREEKNYKNTYKNNLLVKSVCDDGTYEEYSYKETNKAKITTIKNYTSKKKLISTTTSTIAGNKNTTITKAGSKNIYEGVSKKINGKYRVISEKRCDNQGKLSFAIKYTYDKYGNPLKVVQETPGVINEETYTNTYDGKKLASSVCMSKNTYDSFTSYGKYENTYYTSGDAIGQVKTRIYYDVDASGNASNAHGATRFEYKMDKHGNVLESIEINENGQIVGKNEYTYKAIKVAI